MPSNWCLRKRTSCWKYEGMYTTLDIEQLHVGENVSILLLTISSSDMRPFAIPYRVPSIHNSARYMVTT